MMLMKQLRMIKKSDKHKYKGDVTNPELRIMILKKLIEIRDLIIKLKLYEHEEVKIQQIYIEKNLRVKEHIHGEESIYQAGGDGNVTYNETDYDEADMLFQKLNNVACSRHV